MAAVTAVVLTGDQPHPAVGRRARRQASDTTASMEPSSMMHASGTARAAAAARVAIDAAAAGDASADRRHCCHVADQLDLRGMDELAVGMFRLQHCTARVACTAQPLNRAWPSSEASCSSLSL